MSLTLPTVSSTIGPDWATQLNAAVTSIDSHDHSPGKGTQVTPAGINVNSEFAMGNNTLSGIGKTTYQNLTVLDTATVTTYFKDGDFFVNDNAGNQIRMTSGGALNVGSVGGIGGDYGSTAATVFYTDASKTYFFQDSTSAPGKLDVGDVTAEAVVASTYSGPGSLPLGAIIPIAANLTGAMSIPSTGTVDSNGFQYCDGAAIAGAATMVGTIYNLTDERFLVGSTTAGTTGGANAITPAGTLSGTQSMAHTHTGPSHTHSGPSHTHSSANHSHGAGSYAAATNSNGNNVFFKEVSMTSYNATVFNNTNSSSGDTSSFSVGADVLGTGSATTPGSTGAAGTGSTGSSGTGATGSGGVTVSFSNGTFTGTSFNNRPLYLSAVYVMRVL